MNRNRKNIEILSQDVNVSLQHSFWEEELKYGIRNAKINLMEELYIKYLSGGEWCKCKMEEKHIKKFDNIESVIVYLYVEKEIQHENI